MFTLHCLSVVSCMFIINYINQQWTFLTDCLLTQSDHKLATTRYQHFRLSILSALNVCWSPCSRRMNASAKFHTKPGYILICIIYSSPIQYGLKGCTTRVRQQYWKKQATRMQNSCGRHCRIINWRPETTEWLHAYRFAYSLPSDDVSFCTSQKGLCLWSSRETRSVSEPFN